MEILFYSLIYTVNLCYKIVTYAQIAGEYCTGTGTGSTRFFRLCNDMWLFTALITEFLVLTELVVWSKSRRPNSIIKCVAFGVYLAYILVSPLMWELPFFLTSAR
jgi:hypothetical protein